jgi:hypothetical protein
MSTEPPPQPPPQPPPPTPNEKSSNNTTSNSTSNASRRKHESISNISVNSLSSSYLSESQSSATCTPNTQPHHQQQQKQQQQLQQENETPQTPLLTPNINVNVINEEAEQQHSSTSSSIKNLKIGNQKQSAARKASSKANSFIESIKNTTLNASRILTRAASPSRHHHQHEHKRATSPHTFHLGGKKKDLNVSGIAASTIAIPSSSKKQKKSSSVSSSSSSYKRHRKSMPIDLDAHIVVAEDKKPNIKRNGSGHRSKEIYVVAKKKMLERTKRKKSISKEEKKAPNFDDDDDEDDTENYEYEYEQEPEEKASTIKKNRECKKFDPYDLNDDEDDDEVDDDDNTYDNNQNFVDEEDENDEVISNYKSRNKSQSSTSYRGTYADVDEEDDEDDYDERSKICESDNGNRAKMKKNRQDNATAATRIKSKILLNKKDKKSSGKNEKKHEKNSPLKAKSNYYNDNDDDDEDDEEDEDEDEDEDNNLESVHRDLDETYFYKESSLALLNKKKPPSNFATSLVAATSISTLLPTSGFTSLHTPRPLLPLLNKQPDIIMASESNLNLKPKSDTVEVQEGLSTTSAVKSFKNYKMLESKETNEKSKQSSVSGQVNEPQQHSLGASSHAIKAILSNSNRNLLQPISNNIRQSVSFLDDTTKLAGEASGISKHNETSTYAGNMKQGHQRIANVNSGAELASDQSDVTLTPTQQLGLDQDETNPRSASNDVLNSEQMRTAATMTAIYNRKEFSKQESTLSAPASSNLTNGSSDYELSYLNKSVTISEYSNGPNASSGSAGGAAASATNRNYLSPLNLTLNSSLSNGGLSSLNSPMLTNRQAGANLLHSPNSVRLLQKSMTKGSKAMRIMGSINPQMVGNGPLLKVSTSSTAVSIKSVASSTLSRTAGGKKQLQKRLFFKNGNINISRSNIDKRRRRYLTDIFTTLIDLKWRYNIMVFALGFFISWFAFATIWYSISYIHGDLDPYKNHSACIAGINTFAGAILFSIETQQTIGYGVRYMTEKCAEAIFVMMIQSSVGVMIQSFMVGVVFAKLSRPKKRSETLMFSKNAVISLRDGRLCLICRVGDMRKSHIVEAHVRMYLIKKKVTLEGEIMPLHMYDLNVGWDKG